MAAAAGLARPTKYFLSVAWFLELNLASLIAVEAIYTKHAMYEIFAKYPDAIMDRLDKSVSYTHLRAHET